MKKAKQFVLILFSLTMLGAFLTACGQEEGESYASKAHSEEYLVQESCYVFEDGASADHYERGAGYYFLNGTGDVLLEVDAIPEIWDYEDTKAAMSQEARDTLQKTVESLPLYDLNQLLDRAYADYCFCRDSDNADEVFNYHVVFINATEVSAGDGVLTCSFDISYAPEGHFENEMTGEQQTYSFDMDTGELIE